MEAALYGLFLILFVSINFTGCLGNRARKDIQGLPQTHIHTLYPTSLSGRWAVLAGLALQLFLAFVGFRFYPCCYTYKDNSLVTSVSVDRTTRVSA